MNFLLFYSQSKGVSDLWNDWRNVMNFKSQNHNTNSFKNKFQSHSTKIKSICKSKLQSIYTQTERQKRKPIDPTFKGIWYPELVQKEGTMGT